MSEEEQSAASGTCPVEMSIQMSIGMSHEKPCGRLIHEAPKGVDEKRVCLMHSLDPNKDPEEFVREINDILNDKSGYHSQRDRFNFTRFVFPKTNFQMIRFTRPAIFHGATFTQEAAFYKAVFTHEADFYGATFTQKADFLEARFIQEAAFRRATFSHHATFGWATFTHNTAFRGATFTHGVDFTKTVFLDLAEFSESKFEQPERVRFHQINKKSTTRFRARFLNCEMEKVSFEDVNWYRKRGRMVLQDELDIPIRKSRNYELVAVAYRRLINNFERVRAYDWAEDCSIGAMEMRRLNPENFLLGRFERIRTLYEKFRPARKVGEWVSILNFYRLLSSYGSSYTRALGVLFIWLFLLAGLYCWAGLEPKPSEAKILIQVSPAWPNWLIRLGAGVLHAFEVATFQRNPIFTPVNVYGRIVAILEIILIPGQLALLFLALRRRFRR